MFDPRGNMQCAAMRFLIFIFYLPEKVGGREFNDFCSDGNQETQFKATSERKELLGLSCNRQYIIFRQLWAKRKGFYKVVFALGGFFPCV